MGVPSPRFKLVRLRLPNQMAHVAIPTIACFPRDLLQQR